MKALSSELLIIGKAGSRALEESGGIPSSWTSSHSSLSANTRLTDCAKQHLELPPASRPDLRRGKLQAMLPE